MSARPLALALAVAACAAACGRAADASVAARARDELFVPPPPSLAARAAPSRQPGRPEPLRVPVRLSEWTVQMPGRLPAGRILFLIKDVGHEDHAFRIYGNGIDRSSRVVEPMMSTSLAVTLARGVYHVQCPVDEPEERENHAKMGMVGTVTIY